MKTKSLRFPEELIERINEQAKSEDRNFSNMIRHCVKEYLDENRDLQD